MKIQVKKLNQSQVLIKPQAETYKRPLFLRSKRFLSRWRSRLHDQVYSCKCYHMIFGHRFISEPLKAGKCDYPDCFCEVFEPIEIIFIFRIPIEDEKDKVEEYKGGLF